MTTTTTASRSALRCLTCPDKPLMQGEEVLYHLMGRHKVIEEQLSVAVSNIIDDNRQRKDYKDVHALAQSIKRFGLIQPVVLQQDSGVIRLVAGGRRLAALRSIGLASLDHGKQFVWRDEDMASPEGHLRLQAVELEENLRREDLHWSEEVAAKLRLLKIMQNIHGGTKGFGAGKTSANDSGFGIRTLAAMLGENPSTTSRDIELAGYVEKHPLLATMPTKADAQRKLGVAVTVAAMQIAAKKSVVRAAHNGSATVANGSTTTEGAASATTGSGDAVAAPVLSSERWTLYEGPFQ